MSARIETESTSLQGVPMENGFIGDLIRNNRRLSDEQVQQILEYQRDNGVRFGEAAVALELASSEDILHALSQQFHYPYASEYDERQYGDELVVVKSPFSDEAEKFRDLRSQLLMGVLSAEFPKAALAITSPRVGDGKSLIAANLAVAFGQLGGRTLLVDADMRTPRLHKIFGHTTPRGLSNLLSGRLDIDAVLQVGGFESLFLLPVGAVPPNPVELIQRPAFGMLMRELIMKFDHVIVDTPASMHGPDSRVIASKCGAAIVVAKRANSKMDEVQTLLNSLQKANTRVAGVIMNDGSRK